MNPDSIPKRRGRPPKVRPAQESAHYVVSGPDPEFLVVADQTSEVLVSDTDSEAVARLAATIRKAGGQVTVFVSTEL